MTKQIKDAIQAAQFRYAITWTADDGKETVLKRTMYDVVVHYRWTTQYDPTATDFKVFQIMEDKSYLDVTDQFKEEVAQTKLWTLSEIISEFELPTTRQAVFAIVKSKLIPEIDYIGFTDRFRIFTQSGCDKIVARYGKK